MQNDFQVETSLAVSPLVLPEAGFVLAHLAELYWCLRLRTTAGLSLRCGDVKIVQSVEFMKDTVTQIIIWSIILQ